MTGVPESRRIKASSYTFEKDRRLSLGAWLLLERALKDDGAVFSDEDFSSDENGKPFLLSGERRFNISHSENYAAAAVSRDETGVDIEMIRPQSVSLAERFFHPDEIAFLRGYSGKDFDREFTRIWTRKEAYLKAAGSGLLTALSSFSSLESEVSGYRVETFFVPEGYVLSVAHKTNKAVVKEQILV